MDVKEKRRRSPPVADLATRPEGGAAASTDLGIITAAVVSLQVSSAPAALARAACHWPGWTGARQGSLR